MMSATKVRQVRDKKKQERVKQIQDKQRLDIEAMPMNKFYLTKKHEDGRFVYDNAKQFFEMMLNDIEGATEAMRSIAALVHNIRHSIQVENKWNIELNSEVIKSSDENGRIYTKEELYNKIVAEKINRHRYVANIRKILTDKLMIRITEDGMTAELFDDYVEKLKRSLIKLGYDLFPKGFEMIYPEG